MYHMILIDVPQICMPTTKDNIAKADILHELPLMGILESHQRQLKLQHCLPLQIEDAEVTMDNVHACSYRHILYLIGRYDKYACICTCMYVCMYIVYLCLV